MFYQKFVFIFFLFLSFLGVSHADPKIETVRKAAEKYAAAIQKNDFNAVAQQTYPKLVEMLGGKEKMASNMNQTMELMKVKGFKIISVTVQTPGPIATYGDKMYSLVLTDTLANTHDDKVTQISFLLAVSTDKGATWTFLDGAGVDTYNINDIIPEFPREFKLPYKEPARMEPLINSNPTKS